MHALALDRRAIEELVGFHVVGMSEPLRDETTGESVRLIYGECGEFRADYRIAPGGFIPFAHAHTKQAEVFDVKRGSFTLSIDGVERVAHAGDRLAVPPGAMHSGRNAGDEEVHIVVAFEPLLDADALFERYWRMRDGARRGPCLGRMLFSTCDLESETFDAAIPRRVQRAARRVASALKQVLLSSRPELCRG